MDVIATRRAAAPVAATSKTRLPFLVWGIVIPTFVSAIGGQLLFGYNVSAVGWIVPLLLSLFTIFTQRRQSAFPWGLWLPWVVWGLAYLAIAESPNALQRTVMMFCPLLTGIAIAKIPFSDERLVRLKQGLPLFAGAFLLLMGLKSGLLLTGQLPGATGLASAVMTSALLATIFAVLFETGERRALLWWWAMVLVPVVALTRTGVVVSLLTLPLTFAPIKTHKRIILLMLIAIAGIGVFSTERFQQKMFFSGQGSMRDVSWDNPDLATSGRKFMWDLLMVDIEREPWLGHGTNATESLLAAKGLTLTHPHNDWLRITYDYGLIGAGVFALCLLLQLRHLLRSARACDHETRKLFLISASSMVVFALFMISDNILLYASFFGNLQFMIMGIAYSRLRMLKRGELSRAG